MRVYLSVPYPEKDEAKAGGALFCRDSKAWFVCNPPAFERCRQWLDDPSMECPAMDVQRDWQFIRYEDRDQARRSGLRFDGQAKCWYRP